MDHSGFECLFFGGLKSPLVDVGKWAQDPCRRKGPCYQRRALSRGVDWDILANSQLLSTLTLT